MKRRLFNAGAAVSLVLCLGVAGLWARSYWHHDRLTVQRPELMYQAVSFSGRTLWIWFDPGQSQKAPSWSYGTTSSNAWGDYGGLSEAGYAGSPRWWNRVGFVYRSRLRFIGGNLTFVVLPNWAPCVVLSLAPAVWIVRRIRNPASARTCPACGYDLRGTPGSECPECGAASGEREAEA